MGDCFAIPHFVLEGNDVKIRNKKIMSVAVLAGELLLKSGAEVARVQDTIERILIAMKVEDWNVFVISIGIFVTIDEMTPSSCSAVRHVPISATDLNTIVKVNQISRELCEGKCSLDDAFRRLEHCKNPERPSEAVQILAAGFGCMGFSYLFGSPILDCIVAFFIAAFLQKMLLLAGKKKMLGFLCDIMGGAVAVLAVEVLMVLGLPINLDSSVIGVLMLLVPGVSFVTGIRDLFACDYLSGTIHLIFALLTAVSIAIGVGAGILFIQAIGGTIS